MRPSGHPPAQQPRLARRGGAVDQEAHQPQDQDSQHHQVDLETLSLGLSSLAIIWCTLESTAVTTGTVAPGTNT
jgi:hypothetical protein